MNKSYKWMVLALTILGQALPAQESLDTLLRQVAENNMELQAALHRYEAEVLTSRLGNTPPNPEVEYGYMWGDPEPVGDRVDLSVTQTFDFPTAYTSQSKLRKINAGQASLKLDAVRQEVLAAARKSWIDAVYLNMKKALITARIINSEQVYTGFQKKFETGEANQLQMNQAFLKYTLLKNEHNLLLTTIENNRNEMRNLAGGTAVIIEDSILPPTTEIHLDTLLAAYGQGPASAWYNGEVEKWAQQKDVNFNNKLPRLMAGYYSESILGVDLRGVKAGITIPLWGDAHAVNRAKAGMVFAESDAWRYQAEERTRLTNLFSQWATLRTQLDNLREAVEATNNEALLVRSLETGEISLTEYFYESDFYFQSRLLVIESWRDMLKLEAELLKIYN